jgi:threonine/homoserine/homoserine lactone efflux protein
MSWHTWLIYLLAAGGLSLTPDPNSLLALTHGALHGHRRALFTIAGGALGFMLLIALSMLGIGALLQASAHALPVLKWAGGAYLVWLGIQLWRAPPLQLQAADEALFVRPPRRSQLFRQGLFAAVSNPKALLFYGAFLPQFIDPARSLWLQFVVMAGTFMVTECCVEFLLARLAHLISPALERFGKRFNRVCGGLFAAMGLALPLTH